MPDNRSHTVAARTPAGCTPRRRAAALLVGALGIAAAASVVGVAPAFADSMTYCPTAPNNRSACNVAVDNVMQFTHPGVNADGYFVLTRLTDEIDSGHDDDSSYSTDQEPAATLTGGAPGLQFVNKAANAATGAITRVTYGVSDAPFTATGAVEAATVGYDSEVWYSGQDKFSASSSSDYLTADIQAPTDNPDHAVTTTTFADRPLSVQIHNGLPGVPLVKVGDETAGGLLLDPRGTDQDVTAATIAPEDATHDGNAFYGGYRSTQHDASFQVVYEVPQAPAGTDPTSPWVRLAGTQLHLNVDMDLDDPTKQESTCTISSPTSLNTVNCTVTQGGSNGGQSAVAFSITLP
ncbi:hypothetical protein JL107_13160 [Nakamurella flavida]|uniref:Uncharacterized protein n=1 Tax=Nakamurella flavida TaxID=363630 RepID=A0A938YGS4_9ACTN|nr:hypothetical protein [Nakamurella flavida]MBM9477396.1 hypothetical protein [Nakamurella flavida]MDP9777328.1 hypothetical protein [Nakamurella flavida]